MKAELCGRLILLSSQLPAFKERDIWKRWVSRGRPAPLLQAFTLYDAPVRPLQEIQHFAPVGIKVMNGASVLSLHQRHGIDISEWIGNDFNVEQNPQLPAEEMYYGWLTMLQLLNQNHQLPILRHSLKYFCVFCFSYHSKTNHKCSELLWVTEAEQNAGQLMGHFIQNETAIDDKLVMKLRMFVNMKVDYYDARRRSVKFSDISQTVHGSERMGKRAATPAKTNVVSKKKKADEAHAAGSMTRGYEQAEQSSSSDNNDSVASGTHSESSWSRFDSPVFDFGSGEKYSSSGRMLRTTVRYVDEIEKPTQLPSVIKSRPKRAPLIIKSMSDSSGERQESLIRAVIRAGLELDDDCVPPPLPIDKSTWTRQDYLMDHHGTPSRIIQQLKPEFLYDESQRLLDQEDDDEHEEADKEDEDGEDEKDDEDEEGDGEEEDDEDQDEQKLKNGKAKGDTVVLSNKFSFW